jgi:hypothetical protein
VVSEALQILKELLAREVFHRRFQIFPVAQVGVRFDDAGHDGLARQIDPSGPLRSLHLTASADKGELAILHHERRVFDRRGLVAGNQPRTLEYSSRSCRRWRLAGWLGGTRCDEKNNARQDRVGHLPHASSDGWTDHRDSNGWSLVRARLNLISPYVCVP